MASMELGITVPTNPGDLNKTLELTVDPSKNITVMGSCPTNATEEVGILYCGCALKMRFLHIIQANKIMFLDADSIMGGY